MRVRNIPGEIRLLIIAGYFLVAGLRLGASGTEVDSISATDTFAHRLQDAISRKDHYSLNVAMIEALKELTRENLEKAIAIVENSSDRLYRMHAIDLLVRHWAEIAPIDAVDYCFTSLTEEYRFTPLRTALFVWARNDPVGAIS